MSTLPKRQIDDNNNEEISILSKQTQNIESLKKTFIELNYYALHTVHQVSLFIISNYIPQ